MRLVVRSVVGLGLVLAVVAGLALVVPASWLGP